MQIAAGLLHAIRSPVMLDAITSFGAAIIGRSGLPRAGSDRRPIHRVIDAPAPRRANSTHNLPMRHVRFEHAQRALACVRRSGATAPIGVMVELPLIQRMQESGVASYAPLVGENAGLRSFCGIHPAESSLPLPGPGEQYRFHFDMTKCIGCKCCVVACNEQNGNPADILWRRVGEIEGGLYPDTLRRYLSIGCNHCLEPTCMTGCPVDAYSKDSITGIVRHSADACIGCQYCTWNCSYGVPQYNPERGVVGKCDMCYGRLEQGQSPACVSACPEDAIRIEVVNVEEWRREYNELANSPGMPSADDSISTTRITLPRRKSATLQKVNLTHLRTEDPHWPLIVMTVLTQLSVGAFAAIWRIGVHRSASLVALGVAFAALSASTFHLGRPIHALRALRMWRRSWLSREVLLFTIFAFAASAYSAALMFGIALAPMLGAVTVLFGVAGVGASARLYLAPGRPAWNSPITLLEFFATTALLGFAAANLLTGGTHLPNVGALGAALAAFIVLAARLLRLARSSRYELYASWQLLSTVLVSKLIPRTFLLVLGACFLAFPSSAPLRILAFVALFAGEFLGRYLFFVSVIPSNIASSYLAQDAA